MPGTKESRLFIYLAMSILRMLVQSTVNVALKSELLSTFCRSVLTKRPRGQQFGLGDIEVGFTL